MNVGLDYSFALGDLGNLKLRGESYYSSRVFYTAFNDRDTSQGGYTTVNAFITYTSPNDKYELRGFARNLATRPM